MRFRWFWLAALISNSAAAAMDVAVSWVLGDNRLPVLIQFLQHSGGAIGGVVGVVIGTRVVRRFGVLRTVLISSAFEAIGAVSLAVVAYAPDGRLDLGQAVGMVAVQVIVWTAVGMGGPAWVSIVASWPGTSSINRQVLLDSVQFQMGKSLGPLLGGVAIVASAHAVQWTAALNVASFVVVMAVLIRAGINPAEPASASEDAPWRAMVTPEMLAIAGIAFAIDGGRIYLARVMRGTGASGAEYAQTVSVLAAAAVLAGLVAAARSWRTRTTVTLGLSTLLLGLLTWSAGAAMGSGAWLAGAVLIGAGVSLGPSGLTAAAIKRAGNRQSSAVAGLTLARTSMGAVAGVPLALLVSVMGAMVYLPLAAVLTAFVGASWCLAHRHLTGVPGTQTDAEAGSLADPPST